MKESESPHVSFLKKGFCSLRIVTYAIKSHPPSVGQQYTHQHHEDTPHQGQENGQKCDMYVLDALIQLYTIGPGGNLLTQLSPRKCNQMDSGSAGPKSLSCRASRTRCRKQHASCGCKTRRPFSQSGCCSVGKPVNKLLTIENTKGTWVRLSKSTFQTSFEIFVKRLRKLKTQGKNSITPAKNSRIRRK